MLIEAVVGGHILRKSRFINTGLSSVSDLFYWQSKAGKEVDNTGLSGCNDLVIFPYHMRALHGPFV